MMTNFSLSPPSPFGSEQENNTMDYDMLNSSICFWHFEDKKFIVTISFICLVCIVGLLGNGAVIWLLGFFMKRTNVTTYILNLAVADFGVLIFVIPLTVLLRLENVCGSIFIFLLVICGLLFHFLFSISQYLLTIISIDRCVSVLFPIWYRCHRPENLSTILCAVIWIFCLLAHGICDTLVFYMGVDLSFVFLVEATICLPFITISTMILFIKFCLKTQQRQRKKLLLAILLALFFFLFLGYPLNVLYIMSYHTQNGQFFVSKPILSIGFLCASLNSCVNPLIYFFIGRKKKKCVCTENLRLILQRVFKQENEAYGEELQPPRTNLGTLISAYN